LVTVLRFGSIVLGLLLASSHGPIGHSIIAGGVLLGYALWRSVYPIRFVGRRGPIATACELALALAAVAATGLWGSPYVVVLLTPIVVAGLASGIPLAVTFALVACVVIGVPYQVIESNPRLSLTTSWTAELVLLAMLAGYVRRLVSEAEARTTHAIERMRRLSEANSLLFELHRVAQTLPASLDLSETVASTMTRLKDLFQPDVACILLREDVASTWSVAATYGVRLPTSLRESQLASPLRRAMNAGGPVLIPDIHAEVAQGVGFASVAGLYAPLRARDVLVGVMAVELTRTGTFESRHVGLMEGMANQAALAIDNARWFARLRTVGADEERTRIARDLHDRVGSSLAYLGFELDRLCRMVAQGSDVAQELHSLRQDVRKVVSEVRETLYDLRTDVSDAQDLISTVEAFLARVRDRTGVQVVLRHSASRRLPLPQEREMWRIAQEAVTNAERHAHPHTISVAWQCDEQGALLEVADDGTGLRPRSAPRMDSYGMLGMRERADSIGASLDVQSTPGKGTTVRCQLGDR
jgi:signal transduction histidine kinase